MEETTMKKFLGVVENKEERRSRIEDKIEFIKSTITWVLIVLFAFFGLARFNIIPKASVYAAIYTALAIIAMAVIALTLEQIKLFECEEDEQDEEE